MQGFPKKFNRFVFCAIAVFLLTVSFVAGWFGRRLAPTGAFVPIDPTLRVPGNYKYINPLLACGTWESKDFDEYAVFKTQVADYISREVKTGAAEQIGVYFRELKGSHWFGVNENAKFSPASLTKIPLMIAVLKSAEQNPQILNQTYVYDGKNDLNQAEYFRSPFSLTPGGEYTVGNLLKAMIVNSDNNATAILDNSVKQSSLGEVFTDLGMSIPDASDPVADYMSPKSFSYFFRVLYNATYLNEDYSEKALGFLAGPDFPQGIQSTVGAGVTVAQKFGERSVLTPQGAVLSRELHDCGIVYYPNKPYLLCIMTKGNDFKNLLSIIQEIGRTIYSDVKNG